MLPYAEGAFFRFVGTKTLEQAEALRKQTEALFNNGTSVFGRKIAFSQKMAKMLQNELEGVIEEGEKPPDGGVSLSDVAHVTKVSSSKILVVVSSSHT